MGAATYAASGLVTLLLARTLAESPPDLLLPVVSLAVGLIVPVGLFLGLERGIPASRGFELILLGLMLAALMLLCRGALPPRPYGDRIAMVFFVEQGSPFPRWLVGTAAVTWLHVGIWQSPMVTAHLPASLKSAEAFAALLCTIAMGVGSIALLRRWPDRLAIVVPLLTPVWVLFSSGYVEYYPLIAGAWLGTMAWLFEKPLADRSPQALGLIIGLLPALYVGFIGLSLLLLVILAISNPARLLPTLAWTAATLAVLIAVCWPSGIPSFLRELFVVMNFGDQNTIFPRYIGHSAGPGSIFFTRRYAFDHSHLLDLAYMYFWGGGWSIPFLFIGAGGAALWLRRGRTAGRTVACEPRLWLGVGLVAWQMYYFVYMIPKLGPTADVDLFFPTFVAVAFFTGWLLDFMTPPLRRSAAYLTTCALAGSSVVTAVFLAWIGLPTRQ